LSFSTDPRHGLRLADVLDAPAVSGIDLSPDGAFLAIHLRKPEAQPADGSERWTEIVAVEDGAPVRTLRGGESGFAWAPDSRRYSYATASVGKDAEGRSDLWLASLEEGGTRRLLQGVKGLGTVRWLPDAASLIYQVQEKSEADPRGVKLYRGLNDRWAGYRDHGHLYQVEVESGARRRLTAGPDDINFLDVSPDGRRLLFARSHYRPTEWPYTSDDLFELDLGTLEARSFAAVPWFRGAVYDRGGGGVLVQAAPDSFGDGGAATLPANGYDTQLFRLSLEDGAATPLTRAFDPAVEEVAWSGDVLLVRAQVKERFGIFRGGPGFETLTPLSSGLDRIDGLDGDEAGRVLAYFGSAIRRSETVFVRSLEPDGEPRAVYRSTPLLEEKVRLGEVAEWDFEGPSGEISGRLHLPPDFDPAKSYPLIVYYYGGTIPVERNFADRYPFHVWSDKGYVVYVPQPSGATGFGQEFSARHVNDWGETTVEEIIEGTKALLDAHPFLDPKRVGCIGASYGGFMTLSLITRTDLFAAAIAHAGISSISSYW
ncbi:MAG: S9 family peptidase, partial [Acidobacteria bacterium]|nr:S9 family peptidase [Acidobacteriota bacterium]